MVHLGPDRRLHRDHCIDGDGELDLSCAKRNCHSAGRVSGRAGQTQFYGVVLAGTLGSYLGSAITYWASRLIGRPLIVKYGRFVLLTPKKLERAEHWLARYEAGGIFFARLLPVVRHLISIPAGIVRMNFGLFSLMTITGSAIWCYILAYLGDKAYRVEPQLLTDPEALVRFIHGQSTWILVVVAVFAALYILSMRLSKPPQKHPNSG